jgi:hypothetical protein
MFRVLRSRETEPDSPVGWLSLCADPEVPGPIQVRFRSDSGSIQVRFRSDSGPIQVRFMSDSGPIHVRFRSDSGTIQV